MAQRLPLVWLFGDATGGPSKRIGGRITSYGRPCALSVQRQRFKTPNCARFSLMTSTSAPANGRTARAVTTGAIHSSRVPPGSSRPIEIHQNLLAVPRHIIAAVHPHEAVNNPGPASRLRQACQALKNSRAALIRLIAKAQEINPTGPAIARLEIVSAGA